MKGTILLLLLLIASVSAQCPSNCNDCDPNGLICFACAEGFQLSVIGSCVSANIIPKCTLYGPTNQCFVCQPTFSLDNNGNCLKNGSPCIATDPSDDNICTTCAFGTVLQKDKCVGTINCKNSAAPCTGCATGFSLSPSGNCIDNTGNCKTVGSNGICVTCNVGFSLIGYVCKQDSFSVYGCYIYDSNNLCLSCKMGYNLYEGNCLLPSQVQTLQNLPPGLTVSAALASMLAGRTTAITTTTTTTTITTATNTGSAGGDGGFSSGSAGFGSFGDAGFGSFGGFGGFGDSSTSNTASKTSTTTTSSSTTSSSSNSGFGSGDSGFGSSFGFGDSSGFSGSNTNSGFREQSSGSSGGKSNTNSQTTSQGSGKPTSPTPSTQPPPAPLQKIPNCAVADPVIQGKCNTCNPGFSSNGMGCIYVSPLCTSYNLTGAGCLSCKYKLIVVNGMCVDTNCKQQNANVCISCITNFALNADKVCLFSDPNCLAPLDARCGQCKNGFFVTIGGTCQALPPNCAAADMQTLACIQCIPGFQLDNNKNCVQKLPPNCQVADPKNPSLCLVCVTGFVLNNGVCQQPPPQQIIPNCQAYNPATGICVACIPNYNLINGVCVLINSNTGNGGNSGGIIIINGGGNGNNNYEGNRNNNNGGGSSSSGSSGSSSSSSTTAVANRDANCVRYNGQVCASCSTRYYFGPNGLCVPVNPLCKEYFNNGSCSSCYPSYIVSGSTCIVNGRTSDPYCKSYSAGGACVGCYTGYFLSQAAQVCQALNPLCKTSNLNDGTCSSCFPGYTLNSGRCSVAFQDPNCQKFASGSSTCIQCSSNFFLSSDGKCKQINPICKTADQSTGACLTCYSGYVIQGALCVLGGASNIDVNCAAFNNGACVKCSNNYYLNAQGVCTQFNPLCRTSNSTNGACLSCYPGYSLQSGLCVLGTGQTSNADPNCKSTDTNGACTACYSSYYLSAQGTCVRVDPMCKTYTQSMSQCASCYDGYSLSNGQCLVSTQAPNANNDANCIKSQGVYCITCANGFYLAPNGTCILLNPLCKTSDMTTGACTDCYPGYTLAPPTCIIAAPVNIPFCQTVVGISCTVCISGYYVSNGGCALANTLCATYDPNTGACWSCNSGYVFQSGGCIYPSLGIDPNCQFYTNSFCSQCLPGYALVSYVCNQIDPNCTQFDNVQNVCKTCSGGKTPQGPQCV